MSKPAEGSDAAKPANPPPPPKEQATPVASSSKSGKPDEPEVEERVTGQDVKACFKVTETKPNGDYRWHCLSCSVAGWSTPNAMTHLKSCDEAQKRPEVQRVLKYYKPRNRRSVAPKSAEAKTDGAKSEPAAKKARVSEEPRVDGKDVRACFKVTETKPNGDYKWTCLSCPATGWSTAEGVTHLKGCKEALKRPEVLRVVELYRPRRRKSTASALGGDGEMTPKREAKSDAAAPSAKRVRKGFSGVFQTDLAPGKGNALQACVASVLGLDLNAVPNFAAMPGEIHDHLRQFLATRSLGFMKITLEKDGTLPYAPSAKKFFCLLAGDSPRGDYKHVVVAEIGPDSKEPKAIFDPHPTGEFLKNHSWVGLFVALEPAMID